MVQVTQHQHWHHQCVCRPPPMSTRDLASWSTRIRGAKLGLTPVGIWPGLSFLALKGSPLVEGAVSFRGIICSAEMAFIPASFWFGHEVSPSPSCLLGLGRVWNPRPGPEGHRVALNRPLPGRAGFFTGH